MAKQENAKELRPKKGRSLDERLMRVGMKASMKPGEHPEDLVLYRNNTQVTQIVTDDRGVRNSLLPRQYTEKSFRQYARDKDESVLQPFEGGTVILTRKRGQPLVAQGILEEMEIVDKADPTDYEEVEVPSTVTA